MMKKRLERIEQEILSSIPDKASQAWFSRVCSPADSSIDLAVVDSFCSPGRDLLRRGGKRWRPLLMVLTAEAFGGEEAAEAAYQLSPVVELPHNGSLIIDDIEDGSDMRRGLPAVHTIYGIDLSINAGNLLYYLPTSCIDDCSLSDHMKLQVYQIYSKYLRRVHFGQGFDISWHKDPSYIPDEDSYELMCRLKTGCLSAMAAEIGACCAKSDTGTIHTVGELAQRLGVAFQVMDDVVNLETGNPGKMRGDDIYEGKKSLPMILHASMRPDEVTGLTGKLGKIRSLSLDDPQAQQMIEEVISEMELSGAISAARKRAEQLYREVISGFKDYFPAGTAKDELLDILGRLA